MVCIWEKYKGKFVTDCGHQAYTHGRRWLYCPYCGERLRYSRKRYQEEYHKKHRKEHAEYYKKYYKDRE